MTDAVTHASTPRPARLPKGSPRSEGRVVAVIPAYNEERFIASVVFSALENADVVLVVDDGSTDRTRHFAERAGATVIALNRNSGKAAALNRGFNTALDLNPDVIVCLDGDAQHDPSEIPTVVTPVLEGTADVVIGSRFSETRSDIPTWRKFGQHSLTAVTNALSGVSVSDSQSGFRAFSPGAARALRFRSGGLGVESEMQFLFDAIGVRVAEVPISVQYRDGNKRNPFAHGLEVLDTILSLVARRRPLMFFSLPGFLVAAGGLALGADVVGVMQRTDQLMVGSAVLTMMLVLLGVLFGVTGIMLHSIGHFMNRLSEELDARYPSSRTDSTTIPRVTRR